MDLAHRPMSEFSATVGSRSSDRRSYVCHRSSCAKTAICFSIPIIQRRRPPASFRSDGSSLTADYGGRCEFDDLQCLRETNLGSAIVGEGTGLGSFFCSLVRNWAGQLAASAHDACPAGG